MTDATSPAGCKHCGTPLVRKPSGPPPVYCSGKCRAAAKHQRDKATGKDREYAERAKARRAAARISDARPCLYCGEPMTNPRRVQCGAPECKRRFNAERMRVLQLAHKAKTGQWLTDKYGREKPRTCIQCGKVWQTGNAKAKYCSNACQAAYEYGPNRKPKLTPAERHRARARRLLDLAAEGIQGTRTFVVGTCYRCGLPATGYRALAFTARGLFYCSSRCRRRDDAAERRVLREADRQAIYRRDKWVCQICKRPVARSQVVPHPKAPVLDHIVPRAEQGEDDPSNLRLAHFLCNSIRQHHGGGEQLALIG